MAEPDGHRATWRDRLHEVIFEADTPAGKAFDVALLVAIGISVLAVMLESVEPIQRAYGPLLDGVEWTVTVLFTVEYALRLVCVRRPMKYATSFFGIVDLLAVLPTYLSIFVDSTESMMVIRALRLLRIFRVFKLPRYIGEARTLSRALVASRRKLLVFVGTVMTIVLIVGALMYLIEGPERGFTSIPTGMYWAVVTVTTVGYGDIAPQTVLGQILASGLMLTGFAIIAVPTGIVTAELVAAGSAPVSTQACRSCAVEGHDVDARYCKACGAEL